MNTISNYIKGVKAKYKNIEVSQTIFLEPPSYFAEVPKEEIVHQTNGAETYAWPAVSAK